MKDKTQVYSSRYRDHIRTRLTHVLEVMQIARTISRALDLNEDLTEAIALGHDLGHTPFGHTGERTINKILNEEIKLKNGPNKLLNEFKGFKHNWQGIRIVSDLAKPYFEYKGINITNYSK
ncbi:HD domain-containing protein [Oceanotoga sp. DSM 15011]|nr:HD domain-containing protein [Oceanotoga sp. DSM 15011]UYP00562.1 HD domain-containing protein [Oceanotoga sp. DSM 15011]